MVSSDLKLFCNTVATQSFTMARLAQNVSFELEANVSFELEALEITSSVALLEQSAKLTQNLPHVALKTLKEIPLDSSILKSVGQKTFGRLGPLAATLIRHRSPVLTIKVQDLRGCLYAGVSTNCRPMRELSQQTHTTLMSVSPEEASIICSSLCWQAACPFENFPSS